MAEFVKTVNKEGKTRLVNVNAIHHLTVTNESGPLTIALMLYAESESSGPMEIQMEGDAAEQVLAVLNEKCLY